MSPSDSRVWQNAALSERYLSGIRGALPLAAEQLDVLRRLSQSLDRPVRRILDVGCGDGILGGALLDAHPEASAVLLDFSPTMLEAAVNRFKASPDRAVEILELDYGDPSWTQRLPPGRFDLVVSGYSIHHQPDDRKREIYREIFDLLEPGGLFVNVEHVASEGAWASRLSDELLVDAFFAHQQSLGSGKSRDEVANEFVYRDDKQANILAPTEAQCGWLREIGFEDVDCWLRIFELAVFGGRKPVGRFPKNSS